MITAYITIGNSDDRLPQRRWAAFVLRAHEVIAARAATLHGSWVSPSAQQWQNACWCAVVRPSVAGALKDELRLLAKEFEQDSIAWAEAPETEFLCAG